MSLIEGSLMTLSAFWEVVMREKILCCGGEVEEERGGGEVESARPSSSRFISEYIWFEVKKCDKVIC